MSHLGVSATHFRCCTHPLTRFFLGTAWVSRPTLIFQLTETRYRINRRKKSWQTIDGSWQVCHLHSFLIGAVVRYLCRDWSELQPSGITGNPNVNVLIPFYELNHLFNDCWSILLAFFVEIPVKPCSDEPVCITNVINTRTQNRIESTEPLQVARFCPLHCMTPSTANNSIFSIVLGFGSGNTQIRACRPKAYSCEPIALCYTRVSPRMERAILSLHDTAIGMPSTLTTD